MKDKDIVDIYIAAFVLFILSLGVSIYIFNLQENHIPIPTELRTANKILVIIVYVLIIYASYLSYERSHNELDRILLIAAVISIIPPIILYFVYLENLKVNVAANPLV